MGTQLNSGNAVVDGRHVGGPDTPAPWPYAAVISPDQT
jgi:hypothetical protein